MWGYCVLEVLETTPGKVSSRRAKTSKPTGIRLKGWKVHVPDGKKDPSDQTSPLSPSRSSLAVGQAVGPGTREHFSRRTALDLDLARLRRRPGGKRPPSLPEGTVLEEPAWIDDDVTLGRNCRIGPDVVSSYP